ncbi:hypothetical protein BACOVA_03966 [Bacteroides ovatus ATCC 8483]|uniref:Uncharacterized protein n=1 Tax=Bacteroides ovatus (strain ATCC 8483 / DSM 1896 / JCM 5824 / BCRC 10623 / CCUG 4943 / NCTC 11153) TaxID=411476 RepID=A0AAN3D662_BACO1|nr:hypothetical protein BACOVA_03966 [Bacteroides ovatus ATCC 8483]
MFFFKNLPIDRKKTFNGEITSSVYRFCGIYNMYVPSLTVNQ